MGMGGHASRLVWGADEITQTPTDTGGWKYLYQRGEEHHHHGSGCNRRDTWANDTRYDACRAIHHRTAQLACGATDELLLFPARCED